jgi:hypothetical protein
MEKQEIQETQSTVKKCSSKQKTLSNCPACAEKGKTKKHNDMFMFDCECGKKYCQKHRYPESHSCEFNYRDEKYKEKKLKRWMGTSVVVSAKLGEI